MILGKPESPKAAWETRTKYAEAGRIAVVMVGLPARGKSFIARNLARYLLWIGVRTHVVSVAAFRNATVGDGLRAPFFDPSNKEALEMRTEIADRALNHLIAGFDDGGQIGILDASNTTELRRAYIHRVLTDLDIKVIFLECLYAREEDDLVLAHVQELRMACPEYQELSDSQALADFKERIQYYRPDYVTMGDSSEQSFAYIQIFDGAERIVSNQVFGFLPTKILFYLMNIRNQPHRTIYLCQSDPQIDADKLYNLLQGKSVILWTDVGQESCRLCAPFDWNSVRLRATLSALNPGQTEGLTHEQIKETFPEEWKRHSLDPYHHRYPRAESYHDLVIRLESIIMELERDPSNILIIADASVLRCIYAYYIEASPFLIPSLILDPRELIVLQPQAYGCHETRLSFETGTETLPRVFRQYTYLG